MPRVAIVADSSACLPPDLVRRYGINIVPLALLIDGAVIPDGSLTPAELFARLDAAKGRAQTSSPAPGEFIAAMSAARETGADAVLCLTLSAAYSGTYSAAAMAKQLAVERLPGLDVQVVDTGGLATAHGFAVLAAARALDSGVSADEAGRIARDVGTRARLVGALETFRYLVKGGRVPWIVGWAASILRIRPVLVYEDGKARSFSRARTWNGAADRMLGYLHKKVSGAGPLHVAAMSTGEPERAEWLAERVRNEFRAAETMTAEFTSVMAVHTGPGFAGLAFYEGE
jgi:DegV family protein with EDD domain